MQVKREKIDAMEENGKQSSILHPLQEVRSEEIQAIIDRMPTGWVKWVALCVAALMGVVTLMGFLIQYPDTVDGQISVTARTAPVRLVTGASGRIIILKNNRSRIAPGDAVACIETGAHLCDVLSLDSILKSGIGIDPPDSLILGDLGQAYSSYVIASTHYKRTVSSDIYPTMRLNLENTIRFDEEVLANLMDELSLRERNAEASRERLSKDSTLASIGGLSLRDYEEKRDALRSTMESLLNFRSGILSKQSEISSNRMELRRIALQETETEQEAYSNYITARNILESALEQWKERYLLIAPVDGVLEYIGFLRDNDFVQSGTEAFSIIPERNEVVGEVMIPSTGAGKVETGQTVNVKMNSFPYDEYGYLRGRVGNISRLTKSMQTSNGTVDVYLVTVTFPEGLVTNFGRHLPLDFESLGTAEIITRHKCLFARLFDNLKSRGVK